MKFSIIITTYNRANIIPMCLDSLINQSYSKSDYEIIIVNNNSTDNIEQVAANYIKENPDVNIRYYFTSKRGQVYARQMGILASQNEILSFTDDDGILDSDWLKEISKVFLINDKVVGVAGKINIKWDEPPPDWIYEYESYLGKLDYGNEVKFEVGMYMNAGNLSIKKDVLIEVGGFNPEMVGEWLIGDGETGLWNKLKEKNYLIGWAPGALMHHYQIVKKNATVEDIKRRFMNNGICVPYNIYAVKREGNKKLIKNMIHSLKKGLKWGYKRYKSSFAKNKKGEYYAIFRRAFYYAQVGYTLKIFFNKEFRTEITKEDWLVENKSKEILP
ncbi:MAG: glycosyltransferase [Bacteroidota bacterium]|nr:glycosyltransferase [Bacteroidota bacterium]